MKIFNNGAFKKLGFTLGEALITIGIIGVISALTIPALMKSTNDAETVAKVKKAYNTLVNAYDQVAYDNDNLPATQWTENAFIQMQDKIKHVRTSNCFATYDGISIPGIQLITGDGIAYAGSGTGRIFVDINGAKKPNKSNVDLFTFEFDIDRDTIIPAGLEIEPADFTGSGANATAWVIFNDNLDYNKNCGTLTWNGNKSCREAKANPTGTSTSTGTGTSTATGN